VELVTRPEFSAWSVTCQDDGPGWSAEEPRVDHRLVLVRRGRFRRRAPGGVTDLDSTHAYLGVPGEPEEFAHPTGGGDVCTALGLAPALWASVVGESARPTRPTVYVDAALDLAHRQLLAATATGDAAHAVAERLVRLLAAAVGPLLTGPTPLRDPTSPADRRLVATAREAIAADHPAARGLLPLADLLGASPYRLSRAFTREVGVSLTRYRNRVRVGRALDRLERGEPDLAALAADLDFADQSHLCRTVRAHVGHPPAALRRLLHHP
jgi:AraC-like DNA-binding protein